MPQWQLPGPLMDRLTSISHNDLRHARARTNFGLYFTWWDRITGTEDPSYCKRFAMAAGKLPPRAQTAGALRQFQNAG